MNKFYANYVSETSQNETDKQLFNFSFKKGDKEVKVATVRCVPETANKEDKKYKELEERLNPRVLDKSFIFLKNLKKDITVE